MTLSRGANPALNSQGRQEVIHLIGFQFPRMALAIKRDLPLGSVEVSLHGTETVMP
ncbi:MAG: hypothetical protein RLZZ09_655 [Pseudomonadota bacterium]|jgi:hypothetical protein